MGKNILLPLILTLLYPFLLRAEWIPLDKQNSSPASPVVTLVSDDQSSTVLKIEISGFDLKNFVSGDKQYQIVDFLTESFTAKPGFPELPYIAKVIAIPDQAGISFEILETGEVQSFTNISLPPARESWLEGSPETGFNENSDAFNSLNAFPGEFVQMESPSIFRDFRISRVSFFPVQYSPAKKELQVVNSITVKITYGTGKVINPKTTVKKPIAPSFGKLYSSLIFNYQSVLDQLYKGKEEGHDLMLCIMPDEFYASFQIYAEWKRLSGIDIHITKFSEIGANATDVTIIKNHVADAYHNWEVPPTYVLIVGDDGVFPVSSSGYANEDFFVEIDGNDFLPEMFIGRFTNQSDYQMQVMINKFLKYEKTPYLTNTDWFKKGICCSNNAYYSQIETKRFAAERMLQDGGFTSVDTMMSDPGCTYSVTDVVNAINDGRSYLNYRGEGWSSGWWASCTPLTTSNLSSVNNGQKFTFVTSIGCGVAMFNASGGNCFGEEWVEMGTISSPKGAAAFMGPTGNTHTTYNNKIDKGIYIGMFQEGLETPGQALVRGKLYMYGIFGNDYYAEYHFRIYCVLGDPSIHIWRKIPQLVTMEYPESIPFGNSLVEFTITYTATGQPVANAQVCVSGETIFATGITDETGKAYVEIDSELPEALNVTVRGGDVIPAQGILYVVVPSGPYVVKDSYLISDEAGGNGNGLLDYGETNLLSLTMKNVGVEIANNVEVAISTSDTYITITDNTANYGNIEVGSTAVVIDGFAYTVANDIPDLHPVSVEITATTGSDSWVSYIVIEAHAPELVYVDYILSDPSGNNNGKLDPGETANITITIENAGSSQVVNVFGEITEEDPYVTLNSSQMNFGNLESGGTANAVYSLTAAINTPAGHFADIMLDLSADLGISATDDFGIIIGQIPVLLLDLDGNENSSPAMEDSFGAMDISYEVLSQFPVDLNLYSTIFLCLGIFPDNHQLTASQGQVLVEYLNNGGSLYMEGGDTWAYDPETAVHPMFNINGVGDGGADMNVVLGKPGTFTEDMSFTYNGDNSWMDHLEPITPAFKIFENQSPAYGTGIAYDAGDYKTIGASHEFGGLVDGEWPSTKEELMKAYLEFFGISLTLQATFNSSVVEVCENGTVNYFDLSTGNPSSWEWTFEGGNPGISSEENPTVLYSIPGIYDVSLTVSDGVDNSTITITDYITVLTTEIAPPAPTGPFSVCASNASTSYSTTGLPGIAAYDWLLEPVDAGSATGGGLSTIILWDEDFIGDATLKVAGENLCGTGAYSAPITITRYFPEVTLAPFNWVCLGWPAFELSGGNPEGGTYSGPGVDNGWFDPTIAGIGTHTITYTYMDLNSCESFDTETILVDPCTGINATADESGIIIYPNPTKGIVTIEIDKTDGSIEVLVVNTLNKVVYSETLKTITSTGFNLDLSKLVKGVYYIKLKTDKLEKTQKIILQ